MGPALGTRGVMAGEGLWAAHTPQGPAAGLIQVLDEAQPFGSSPWEGVHGEVPPARAGHGALTRHWHRHQGLDSQR